MFSSGPMIGVYLVLAFLLVQWCTKLLFKRQARDPFEGVPEVSTNSDWVRVHYLKPERETIHVNTTTGFTWTGEVPPGGYPGLDEWASQPIKIVLSARAVLAMNSLKTCVMPKQDEEQVFTHIEYDYRNHAVKCSVCAESFDATRLHQDVSYRGRAHRHMKLCILSTGSFRHATPTLPRDMRWERDDATMEPW